ncbi:hypothetical protein T06_16765 [Trichinella sp. T6]|nr:hypothetical protein T06_16765 [Trichinella sp. T6]
MTSESNCWLTFLLNPVLLLEFMPCAFLWHHAGHKY